MQVDEVSGMSSAAKMASAIALVSGFAFMLAYTWVIGGIISTFLLVRDRRRHWLLFGILGFCLLRASISLYIYRSLFVDPVEKGYRGQWMPPRMVAVLGYGELQFAATQIRTQIEQAKAAVDRLSRHSWGSGLDISQGAEGETDPFSRESIRMARGDDGDIVYSVGPDLRDDHCRVAYDPTNGLVSDGDIVGGISFSERESRFPPKPGF